MTNIDTTTTTTTTDRSARSEISTMDRPSPSWGNQALLIVGTALVGMLIYGANNFIGSGININSDARVMSTKIDQITEDVKDIKVNQRDNSKTLQELYTRKEAQARDEIADRRFQRLEDQVRITQDQIRELYRKAETNDAAARARSR